MPIKKQTPDLRAYPTKKPPQLDENLRPQGKKMQGKGFEPQLRSMKAGLKRAFGPFKK